MFEDRGVGSREDYRKRSFIICTLHQKLLSDQIRKNEMGVACGTHGGGGGAYRVLVNEPRGKNTFERSRRRRKNNLNNTNHINYNTNNIKMKYSLGSKIVSLRQEGVNWRNRLKALVNRQKSYNADNCWLADEIFAFEEGLCSA
jgi:hypothetical protein